MRLRDGLSWCLCGNRTIFLDLYRDRYFGLKPEEENAFRSWLPEQGACDASALARLEACGLLVAGEPAVASPSVAEPQRDLADAAPAAPLGSVGRAVVAQLYASIQLRHRPLRAILESGARSEARCAAPTRNREEIAIRVAAAFVAAGLIVRSADQCLPRALAARAICRSYDLRTSLVFGVRLDPFLAHCWLQQDDAVIVGDLEQIRLFTPILVVP